MAKREKRSGRLTAAARRAQLIDVGRAVFAKRGYEATSVEEIAKRANVSKPIVYEHFGGKEGLYAVIVDREVEHIVTRIVEAITAGSARERLEQAVLAFLTYVKERPGGFAILLRDAPTSSERRGTTRRRRRSTRTPWSGWSPSSASGGRRARSRRRPRRWRRTSRRSRGWACAICRGCRHCSLHLEERDDDARGGPARTPNTVRNGRSRPGDRPDPRHRR
jgi:AcrR family transcriptional regulator